MTKNKTGFLAVAALATSGMNSGFDMNELDYDINTALIDKVALTKVIQEKLHQLVDRASLLNSNISIEPVVDAVINHLKIK